MLHGGRTNKEGVLITNLAVYLLPASEKEENILGQ
jgi:hypothetical protein